MPRISEEQTEERKVVLLFAALRCFAAKGFDATTMRDIAREAGVAVGTIYLYFEDKRAVFDAVMHHNRGQTRSFLASLGRGDSPLETIEEVFGAILTMDPSLLREKAALDLQLLSVAMRDTNLANWLESVQHDWVQAFRRLIIDAQRAGELPLALSALPAARSLAAYMHGVGFSQVLKATPARAGRKEVRRSIRAILDIS